MMRHSLWVASLAVVVMVTAAPAWAEPKAAAAPMRQGRGEGWDRRSRPEAGWAGDYQSRAIAATPTIGEATPRAAGGIAVRRDGYGTPAASYGAQGDVRPAVATTVTRSQPRAAEGVVVSGGLAASSRSSNTRVVGGVGFGYSDDAYESARPARYHGPVSVPYERRFEPLHYRERYYHRPRYEPVYVAPSPVYYVPRPVYYCPPPVYCAPVYSFPPPVYYCPPRSRFSISFFGRF